MQPTSYLTLGLLPLSRMNASLGRAGNEFHLNLLINYVVASHLIKRKLELLLACLLWKYDKRTHVHQDSTR